MPASLLSKELVRAKVLLGKAYDYNRIVAESAVGSGDVQDVIAKVVGAPVPSEYKDPREWAKSKAQGQVKTAGIQQLRQSLRLVGANVRSPSKFQADYKKYHRARNGTAPVGSKMPNPSEHGYHYPNNALFDAATDGLDAAQRKALSTAWRTGTYAGMGGLGLYLGNKMYQADTSARSQGLPPDQPYPYLDQQGTY